MADNTPQEVAETIPGTGMGGMVTQNLPATTPPAGGEARDRSEEESGAGKAFAEMNAAKQKKAAKIREDERRDTLKMAADARRAIDEENAKKAEEAEGMVPKWGVPPTGPGLPRPTRQAILATMDPNNPVLNPDVSRIDAQRNLPPGARVPEMVLPEDSDETQYASGPLTDAHAEAAKENLGAVAPTDNPALTNEPMGEGKGEPEGEAADDQQTPQATQYPAPTPAA